MIGYLLGLWLDGMGWDGLDGMLRLYLNGLGWVGWFAQGVLGRILSNSPCRDHRGRGRGCSNWAENGFLHLSFSFRPNLNVWNVIFYVIYTHYAHLCTFMQASILKSSFSFCHRLVLPADKANSQEGAAQVFSSTSTLLFKVLTLEYGINDSFSSTCT